MVDSERLKSVADVEGAWVDPEFDSGVIERLKRNWAVPVYALTNEALATFIRQRIGLQIVVPEAGRRLESGFDDDSELYDGELANALNDVDGGDIIRM